MEELSPKEQIEELERQSLAAHERIGDVAEALRFAVAAIVETLTASNPEFIGDFRDAFIARAPRAPTRGSEEIFDECNRLLAVLGLERIRPPAARTE